MKVRGKWQVLQLKSPQGIPCQAYSAFVLEDLQILISGGCADQPI